MQITYNPENEEIVQKHEDTHRQQLQRRNTIQKLEVELAKTQGKLEAYQEQSTKPTHQFNILGNNNSGINIATGDTYQIQYNLYYQQLTEETEKQIIASLTDKEVTPQEQKVINQTVLFLGTKELFINYRQATINSLIECYNKLEKRLGNKLNKFTTAASVMNITSKLASIIPGGRVASTPIELAGDTINFTGTIIRGKFLDKYTKQFQFILAQDKKNLSLFDGNYLSLVNAIGGNNETNQGTIISTIIEILDLKKTELSPFSNDHNAFSQSVSGTWQGRTSLELEEMKSSIEAVVNNFQELKQKLQDQKEQLSKQTWFKTIEAKTDLLQQQQSQIQIDPNVKVF